MNCTLQKNEFCYVDFILIKAKTKMRELPLLHFEVDERFNSCKTNHYNYLQPLNGLLLIGKY